MSKKKKDKQARFKEYRNSKIGRNFAIDDTFEVGIVLKGTEVKSVRSGSVQINDAFARIDKGEVILYHAHIPEYTFGASSNHDPYRPRKLLLKKREILKLEMATAQGGRALIPVRMYFKKGLIKVELALCTGKKLYDKRQDMKAKIEMREAERAVKYKNK